MSNKAIVPTKTPIITRPNQVVTISRYILEHAESHSDEGGDLSGLLCDIALTGKMIAQEVRKAGLVDILGQTGTINVQGEHRQGRADELHTVSGDGTGRVWDKGK